LIEQVTFQRGSDYLITHKNQQCRENNFEEVDHQNGKLFKTVCPIYGKINKKDFIVKPRNILRDFRASVAKSKCVFFEKQVAVRFGYDSPAIRYNLFEVFTCWHQVFAHYETAASCLGITGVKLCKKQHRRRESSNETYAISFISVRMTSYMVNSLIQCFRGEKS